MMNIIHLNALILVLFVSVLHKPLTGIVRSDSGLPLKGVKVYSRSDSQYAAVDNFFTTTDQDGVFVLPAHGRVVFFRSLGFKPVLRLIEENESKLDITLVSESGSVWNIPDCLVDTAQLNYLGAKNAGFKFLVPAQVSTDTQISGADRSVVIKYTYNNRSDQLVYYSSYMILGFPSEQLVLESTIISLRSFRKEIYYGMDMKGRHNDGTYWRYIGGDGMEISYRGASSNSAEYFDGVINNMCFAQR